MVSVSTGGLSDQAAEGAEGAAQEEEAVGKEVIRVPTRV
jgi:hypothetical protein